MPALKSRKLVSAGVDQWRVQNKAMKELMEEHEWFEPMITVVGRGIVKTAAWGLMWRVTLGAVLSMVDLVTDIVVLKQFWDGGEAQLAFRNASLASLSASMGLQLIMVTIQNRKKGIWRITKEMIIVLTGLKAPWVAFKVASGAEVRACKESKKDSKNDAKLTRSDSTRWLFSNPTLMHTSLDAPRFTFRSTRRGHSSTP